MAVARVVRAAAMGLVSTPSETDSEITSLDLLDEDGLPILPDIDTERIASLDDDVDSEVLDRLEEQAEGEMLETMGTGASDEEETQGEEASGSDGKSEEEDHSGVSVDPDAPGPAPGPSGGSRPPSPEVYDFLEPEYVATVISDLREHGMLECLRRYAIARPSNILPLLLSLGVVLPQSMMLEGQAEPMSLLPLLKVVLTRILRQRRKLPQYNTVDDVLELLRNSKRTVVLSGAGISVSCGIPDFRSKDGIYAILRDDQNYQLDDPSDMFDKDFFMQDPSMFFSFAHSIYPANFEPSPSHHFVKQLESHGKLLRMYSQNIDTLEQKAGIERVLQCHGSFATATCTDPACRLRVDGRVIRDHIMAKQVPPCPRCAERRAQEAPRPSKRQKLDTWGGDSEEEEEPGLAYGILKVRVAGVSMANRQPDITFFGEKLPDEFDRCVFQDREEVDLILVMGTSLKVAPVSDLLTHMPPTTPVVLINRTPITHMAMDVMLLGDSDAVVQYLSKRLGWELPDAPNAPAQTEEPQRVVDSHVWLFRGNDGGRFVAQLEGREDEAEESSASGAAAGSDERSPDAASAPSKPGSPSHTPASDGASERVETPTDPRPGDVPPPDFVLNTHGIS